MYPTKSMLDYMTEMNRIFPRIGENDIFQSPPTPNPSLHSFNQSMARSSSSTDTSPDTFPDMTSHRIPPETFYQYERESRLLQEMRQEYLRQSEHKPEMQEMPFMPQLNDTPFVMRGQRPIVGRKIMASNSQAKMDEFNTRPELQTPPNYDQKSRENAFYELFPETKMEHTPVKTSPHSYNISPKMAKSPTMLPGMGNMSPSMKEISSRMPEMSTKMPEMSQWFQEISPKMSEISPRMLETSPRMPAPSVNSSPGSSPYSPRLGTFMEPIVGPSTSFRQNGPAKMCTFCRKNGETPLVYMTHTVKEKVGNKNVVTCPILRSHVCATCRASGDNAHTITYCPVLRSSNNGQPLQSTTITLKNTRVKSNGRRRY